MSSFLVLCDDLTGSSVQSIMLKERGLPVRQVIRPERNKLELPGTGEALVINCDTRRRPESEAAEIFRSILTSLNKEVSLAKRIDTTLRGHLLGETAEMLTARSSAVAIVVPAFPSSGRTTIGGFQLLFGSLLERTEVAHDPIWPISSSFVPDYFRGRFATAHISITDVRAGAGKIAERLENLITNKVRIVISDAMTDGDIETVAEGAASLPFEFCPVDPGPFTAAFLSRKASSGNKSKVLAVLGSTAEKTKKQLGFLKGKISTAEFILYPGETRDEAFERLYTFITTCPTDSELLLLRTADEVLRGSEERMASTLASLGKETLRLISGEIRGILLSGGDIASVFFEGVGTSTLAPLVEIQPLIMGGRILDGDHAGLKVVTKGGLIGEEDGIYRAVRWLGKERE